MRYKWMAKYLIYATFVITIGFGIYNCNYFDIGRTNDKNLSASQTFYVEFSKIPDGAIFMPTYVANWEAIYQYNRDFNKNIYPVCYDMLPSKGYRDQLEKDGVKLREGTDENQSIQAMEIARSIVELNDNVWTTVWTDKASFGSIVVPANHDTSLVAIYDINLIHSTAENPQWHWKPYNPYDIFLTSNCVEFWNYVLLSNWNIAYVTFLAVLGWGCVQFVFILLKRKKKNVVNENEKQE